MIQVELHYTHTDSKLRLKESKQLDIGKPLVASFKLYRRMQAERPEGQSLSHIPYSRQPQRPTVGRPCTRKAECAAAKVTTTRSNEPEENDERL